MNASSKTFDTQMHFKVSSALKRLIGRDLITDEFVAIFELVKNSFDAGAARVDIQFSDDCVYVVDNGKGMSLSDITNKWLFVAYSAKGDGTEDVDGDYRESIRASKLYAGSKGVGRFSCDRLGATLEMHTRTSKYKDFQVLEVEWNLFEENSREEMTSVPVKHRVSSEVSLPKELAWFKKGTVLKIGSMRELWSREKFLKLRSALAKLINPFDEGSDFEINLIVPSELSEDKNILSENHDDAVFSRIVNGSVKNFIFDTLKDKTTRLEVEISKGGKYVVSTLTDRSELVYKIREPNPYILLNEAKFNSSLYFLNRSAKSIFARRMGIPSIRFGSVFLFKNGFRIFPIGEEGVDTFGIDQRKQQGYARFLGTRDIIGRIDIVGVDDRFRESTSRDQGLIDTPAYRQLVECFEDKCFKRLERYVVGVNWKDSLDLDSEDVSRLRGEAASARITSIVAQLAGGEGVELISFNKSLIRILNERSDSFKESLAGLRTLAEKSGDTILLAELDAAANRYQELQRAEAAAREIADKERVARRDAEKQAAESSQKAEIATKSYEEEKKRNLFLTSIASLDKDTIEILQHQIVIHAAAVNEIIKGQYEFLRHGGLVTTENYKATLENIAFQNGKILAIARFATKANFRMESETITDDVVNYIDQYIRQIAPMFVDTGIEITLDNSARSLVRTFKPIELAILIDNFISNAGRADADKISFVMTQVSSKELQLHISDNGVGFSESITDLNRVFEKGYSTSSGSGLGLYHVSQILDSLRGAVVAERGSMGAEFIVRIKG